MRSIPTLRSTGHLRGRWGFLLIFSVLLALMASGCEFDLEPVELPPTVYAQAAVTQGMKTPQPTQSATLNAWRTVETPANQPSQARELGTATHTITPWPNDTPTYGPSPTQTRTPTRTRIPSRTWAPSNTPTVTRTPTITNTPTPPPPLHEIIRPGLMSKVLSPLQVEMVAVTGEDGTLIVELIGEDGRLIAQEILDYDRAGRNLWSAPKLEFEIQTVSELARLQVRSVDMFGRPIAISSVDVILMTAGRSEIYPQAIDQEPYLLRSPRKEAEVSGGMLVVEGLANPVNGSPLILELLREDGSVLAAHQFTVAEPTGELSHTPFTVELPYQVDGPTPVRIVLRQEGSRIPGTVALASRVITLLP